MSGLNDDVDDGLDFTPDVPEINPDQPVTDTKVFVQPLDDVSEEDNPSAQDLFGKDIVKNEVPNLNAEFVLVKEAFNKLTDIAFIGNTIRSANGISKEDAEVVDSVIPGFINDKKPIGFFTEEKSRTQLNETLNTINVTIDTQVAELAIKASTVAEKAIKALSECVRDAEPKLIGRLTSLQDQLGKIPEFLARTNTENYHAASLLRILNKRIDTLSFDRREGAITDPKELETTPEFLDLFNKRSKFIATPRNKTNVELLLYFASSLQNGEEQQLYHMVTYGTFSPIKLSEKDYPILPAIDSQLIEKYLPNFTFYHLFLSGANETAKQYLMTLVNAVVVLIDRMNARKVEIDAVSKTQEDNHQNKLNKLFALHSDNNINSVNSVILLSFVQDYCDYIESIAAALNVLLPAEELT